MATISYAQNSEDVMLQRAFAHIERGFYVDVGAFHPETDSVTQAFYQRGWRGINIEPERNGAKSLKRDRPEDLNLRVVIGQSAGMRTFHQIAGTGLSTSSGEIAQKAADEHGFEIESVTLPCFTLSQILQDQEIDQIHFLKIDVEGAESQVLDGLDLHAIRPWIIVVEATEPRSQIENHQQWETLLTSRSYQFVYADGLNRFYLADEHPELRGAFQYPPNVFDEVVSYRLLQIHELLSENTPESQPNNASEYYNEIASKIATWQTKRHEDCRQLEQELAKVVDEKQHAWHVAAGLESELKKVKRSWSWRITFPWRLSVRGLVFGGRLVGLHKLFPTRSIGPRHENIIKHHLRLAEQKIRRLRKKSIGSKFLSRKSQVGRVTIVDDEPIASPRALQIHLDLQDAVTQNGKAA